MTAPPGELEPLTAALLGVLQGIAEFLPISSSGHLSLAQAWLGLNPESAGHSFNIVLHAGTLLAVLVVYAGDLKQLFMGLRDEGEAGDHAQSSLLALTVATAPLGLVLLPGVEDAVVQMESRVQWVGAALLVTAVLLAATHRRAVPKAAKTRVGGVAVAAAIGIAQLFAVLPGISRSGATIAAGLATGHDRIAAARFSFLMSIPAIAGASAKEILDLARAPGPLAIDPLVFGIGFVASFAVGLASLKGLLGLLSRYGMLPFVPYLVVVGMVAIIFG